jgi:hypothetical protein
MSGTLTSTCPLCGLGYSNRALLELHIREDHPRHRQAAGEPQHDAGSRTTSKVTTKAAAQQPRRLRSPSVLEAARGGIHTLGKLSRQMPGRMAAMFSQKRPRLAVRGSARAAQQRGPLGRIRGGRGAGPDR